MDHDYASVKFDEIFDRMKQATNARTQVELADMLNIRQSSISDAKRRSSVPSDWYMKLFEQFGLNPDWLKHGRGPMYLRTTEGYETFESPEPEEFQNGDPMLLKTLRKEIFSGVLINETDTYTCIGAISLPTKYATEGIQVFQASENVMSPEIVKGAYVGLDLSFAKPVAGELFGVCLPHQGVVFRRLFIDSTAQEAIFRAVKPEQPEIRVKLVEANCMIVGKVAWVFQEM